MFERQMPQYQCHKRVWALQILEVIPNENPDPTGKSGAASYGAVLIVEDDFAPIKVDASYMTKHQPVAGGYYVIYEDGYKSFSPKESFEKGYSRLRVLDDKDAQTLLDASPGPRVTKQQIESRIANVAYLIVPDTNVTICHIELDNGYSVRGESACVDARNFNKQLGEKYSYEDAFRKLWQLFGFLLAEQLSEAS